jgi:hypothetical protein
MVAGWGGRRSGRYHRLPVGRKGDAAVSRAMILPAVLLVAGMRFERRVMA